MSEGLSYRHQDKFEFHAPKGSSICFPRLTTGEPIEDFCERLLDASGVLLLPATMYDSPQHAKVGHFRLGLGRNNFKAGLEQFQIFLSSEKQQ